jgi:hypothetical protein
MVLHIIFFVLLGDSGLSALSQIFSQPGCSSNLTKLDLRYYKIRNENMTDNGWEEMKNG